MKEDSCIYEEKIIMAFHEGWLEEERETLLKHLEACPACKEALKRARLVDSMLSANTDISIEESLAENLLSFLKEPLPAPGQGKNTRVLVSLVSAMAIVIFFLLIEETGTEVSTHFSPEMLLAGPEMVFPHSLDLEFREKPRKKKVPRETISSLLSRISHSRKNGKLLRIFQKRICSCRGKKRKEILQKLRESSGFFKALKYTMFRFKETWQASLVGAVGYRPCIPRLSSRPWKFLEEAGTQALLSGDEECLGFLLELFAQSTLKSKECVDSWRKWFEKNKENLDGRFFSILLKYYSREKRHYLKTILERTFPGILKTKVL